MKSKMSVISCFLASSIMALSINAYATANVTAWTGSSSYQWGDPVDTYATWTVSPTQSWDKCVVTFHYKNYRHNEPITHSGQYVPATSTPSGEVDVWCDDDSGTADFDWDSSEADDDGTWYVEVDVFLDGSPDDGGADQTDDFELT